MTLNLFETPLISVVIPTYNQSDYLRMALKSVFNQTQTNWEVLIIDNNSTDDTAKVIEEFPKLRIRVFKVNNYGSIAISRNMGCAHARGEWIAFLDSDDMWSEDKLQICSKYFSQNVDLIYHDLKVINENTEIQAGRNINSRQVKKPVTLDLILKGNTVATSSVVVRKTLINAVGGMNEAPNLIGIEDYNTWLKISELTEGFKHIKKYLGYYRIHGANTSNEKPFSLPRAAVAEFLPSLSQKEQARVEGNFLYTTARLTYLSKKDSGAINELKKVIHSKYFFNVLKSFWMLSVVFQLEILKKIRSKMGC